MHSHIIKLTSATLLRLSKKVTCSTKVYYSNTKLCNLMHENTHPPTLRKLWLFLGEIVFFIEKR